MALRSDGPVRHSGLGAPSPVQVTIDLQPAGPSGSGYVTTAFVGDRAPVSGSFALPADDWEQHDTRAKMGLESGLSSARDFAVAVGVQLFDALFSGALRRSWAQAVEEARGRGLRLVVRAADPAVHGLPWELLFDRVLINRHLVLNEGWSLVRAVPKPPRVPAARRAGTDVTILVLTSGKADASAEQDLAEIRSSWPDARLEVRRCEGKADVAAALRVGHDVLHVASTGLELPDGRQFFALGDASSVDSMSVTVLLSAAELIETLGSAGDTRSTRLAVLAGSDTDALASELAPVVPAVVGVRGEMSEHGRRAFLRGLYQELDQGAWVETAVSAGRMQQWAFANALEAEWAAPVVFAGGPQRLVPARLESPAPPVAAAPSVAVAPGLLPASRPVGARELELEMRTLDLEALLQQWGPDQSWWPEFIGRQHLVLTREIRELAEPAP